MSPDVDLQKHIESCIAYERSALELRLTHEREMREQETVANAKALGLQAAVYADKLEALNDAHRSAERAKAATDLAAEKALSATVSIVEFRAFESDIHRQLAAISRQLDGYRGALAMGAIVLSLLGLALKFLPIG